MTASIWSPGTTSTPTLPAVAPVQFLPGTAVLPGITFVGDTNTGIWSQSDGWLNFAVNGITRLSINPLGNVIYNGKISTAAEVDIASSTVCDIGSVSSNSVRITGTNAITSFGTAFAGPMFVRFAGALTLANSAVLILPGAVNIAVSAGDALIAIPKATAGISDGWYVVGFQRATAASSGGGGAVGGGADAVFYENGQTITADYTLTVNKNAMTAGPITINTGITVTIPAGTTWSIV